MNKEHYDLCIIGGGPAGYAAAMRAIDFGKTVVLIEKDRVGGAGLFNGALSSKALWEYSTRYATARKDVAQQGLNYSIHFSDAKKAVESAVFERKFQLNVHLKLLQKATHTKLLKLEKGTATLLNDRDVQIVKKTGTKIIQAGQILIATGSRPRQLPSIPADEKIIFTSDGIESLSDFPESMVIVGAGVIGCEYATIFSNFGKTKIFLIDKADRILPFEDEDLAGIVADNLEKNGVVIHRNSSLARMEIRDGKVEYELSYKDGTREVRTVEKALLSIGRIPNTENIGLDAAGVAKDERGYIKEEDTQSSVPHIYAAGDITANIALVNVAEREGRHAVVKMFGPPVKPLVYRNISTIMFLNPEVAAVGMNEQDARAQHISYRLAKIDYSCIPRAIAMRKTNGFFKLMVTDDDEMRVLGMRAVGEHASSAIQAVALLIHMNKGIQELGNMMHPHPSITEGVQECARMLLGKPIYKSSVFKDKLQCYRYAGGVCTPLENL
ncbi:MAG: dihydrolipoyl dehydrogenase family protein [Bacteroidia bacterium]